MRSFFVVDFYPVVGNGSHLIQASEQICIEYFVSVGFVETLDERVLVWLSRLYVAQFYALRFTPVHQGLGDELRSVVRA